MSVLINSKHEAMQNGYKLREHEEQIGYIYPDTADGVLLTAGSSPWVYDGFSTLIPANAIDIMYSLHFLNVGNISANAAFQLNMYYGDTDIYFDAIVFSRENPQNRSIYIPTQHVLIPANSQIRVKLASNNGASETCLVKCIYHKCSIS